MGEVPRLARRSWEDSAWDLERFLAKLKEAWADGIPPGFDTVTIAASRTEFWQVMSVESLGF